MDELMGVHTPVRVTDKELLYLYEEKERRYLRSANRIRGIMRASAAMSDDEAVEDYSLAVQTLEKRANDLRKFVEIIQEVDARENLPIN